jgi:hypothetical protein
VVNNAEGIIIIPASLAEENGCKDREEDVASVWW